MAKKKMCDQYGINPGYNWVCIQSCRQELGIANKNCEIIPPNKKPKKRDVVIKGWCRNTPSWGIIAEELQVSRLELYIPCTIHIKTSDYAKIKGER